MPDDLLNDLSDTPKVRGVRASEVVTKPVEWLWDKRIPKAKLTMFDGDPDVGKSVVTMDLAARVSKGRTFPDGAECETGNVLIVNVEDAKDDTVVPRLKAHGADLERVVIIDGMPSEAENGSTRLLDLPDDVAALKAAVKEYEASLLILDPVLTMLGGDSNKDQDARKALAPIRDMAEETGVTVVAVRHLNKNVSLSAIQRGGGNMGLIGVARAGAFFAHHPDEDGLRVMAPHKSNLAEKQPSLQFVVKGWAIDENIGRVEWMGVTEHDANSLASDARSPGEKSELDAAKEFLHSELEDAPMMAKQILKDARDAGVSHKTLYRAKAVMGVTSHKEGFEGWSWRLPKAANQKDDHLGHVDHLQTDKPNTGHFEDGQGGKDDHLHGATEAYNSSSSSSSIEHGHDHVQNPAYLSEDGQGGQDGQNGHLPLSADERGAIFQQWIDEGTDERTAMMNLQSLMESRNGKV